MYSHVLYRPCLVSFGDFCTKYDFLDGILYLQNAWLCIHLCFFLLIHQILPKSIFIFAYLIFMDIFVLYLAALRSEQWNQSNASGIEASPFENTQLS